MLNADLPIKKAQDDKLNRSSFAKDLASAVMARDPDDGFVIGIYGEWGTGKTSALNMVVEHIESLAETIDRKPVILNFNPWLCADQRQLISQFFRQLSATIKNVHPKIKNICGYMNDYAEEFELAAKIPTIGSFIKYIGKRIQKRAAGRNSNLQTIKDEICKNLRKHKVRLIVTIDDIDRLSDEEIISVFQLVKSMADFPYTTYLLAFDRMIVNDALKVVQTSNKAKYLEKIVQIPFEIPVADLDDVYNIFVEELNKIVGDIPDNKWDKPYWSTLFHYGIKHYLLTIRDVVRFVNTFSLKYSIVKDEVNVIDFIGLTCLQVFEPEVYSRLYYHKDALCGSSPFLVGEFKENERDTTLKSILLDVPESRIDQVKAILSGLFPKLEQRSGSVFFSGGPNRSYLKNELLLFTKSIAHFGCFDRYFVLRLENKAIPTFLLEWLLKDANKLEFINAVEKINAEKKTAVLLEHIDAVYSVDNGDSSFSDRASFIFRSLCELLHILEDEEPITVLSTSLIIRFIWCTKSLLMSIEDDERCTVVTEVFNNPSVELNTVANLLYEFEREHNRFDKEKKYNKPPSLPLDSIIELEKTFMARAEKETSSGQPTRNFSWYVIHLLENIDADKAKLIIDLMIKTDCGLVNLITSAVSAGVSSNGEISRYFSIHIENIDKYIDSEIAYKRVKAFVATLAFCNLDLSAKQKLTAFLLYIERDDTTIRDVDDLNKVYEKAVIARLHELESSDL